MKIRLITLIISVITLSFTVKGAGLGEAADSAYMNDNFARAAELYETIIKTEGSSSNLYYNLGNCYYRQGKPGLAILYYERALRLDPSNGDARANLEFVNSKIVDEPGDRGMFISNTINDIAQGVPANNWAAMAILSFVLLLCCAALYVFSSNIKLRKTGFFAGIILIIVCVVTNIFAHIATEYSTSSNEAIVIDPSTLLSTSPRAPKDRSEEALLLHEGTKVEILDSVNTHIDSIESKWYDVKVDNNNRAWIRSSAVARI
jgi:tetratricopeptide (TPR) repeat protein